MKIIMVDDENASIHSFIDRVIDDPNVECRFFKDNKEDVLSYIRNNKVNGAVLDINMPNINGITLADALIDEDKDIKIVFLTGLNNSMNNLPKKVREHTLGFIYKPINDNDLKHYLNLLTERTSILKVEMFDTFDCFINGSLVKFSSKKSKELFALLLSLNGKSLSMEHAITCLWPDKDLERSKILYRDAVWRLRQTLSDIKFNCVTFQRALLLLNKENIECDYYDYLNGKLKRNMDDFLIEYEWSMDNKYRVI